MSSNVPRVKVVSDKVDIPASYTDAERGKTHGLFSYENAKTTTSKLWRSEGHPINRKTGKYESGGPFHVTHSGTFSDPAYVTEICKTVGGVDNFYTGPLFGFLVPVTSIGEHYSGVPKDQDSSSMNSLGATAISQCSPTNPNTNLGTSLAESVREGIPSLIGIQSWKRRSELAKAAGSEYLNYQFGWAPLVSEVHGVVGAARNHRDILQNYRHNEGRDIHRRFDFPIEIQEYGSDVEPRYFGTGSVSKFSAYVPSGTPARCRTSFRKEVKRWFEGSFTYGGLSSTDSARKALGFGSEADAVYGLTLTPSVLWELTPWSWAVDWFSNTGDVINNATNFGLAGLVMRYGFMMEETIEEYKTTFNGQWMRYRKSTSAEPRSYDYKEVGQASSGSFMITKSRVPANPFGFGVSWEGLSPTQLAITAALGITRFL